MAGTDGRDLELEYALLSQEGGRSLLCQLHQTLAPRPPCRQPRDSGSTSSLPATDASDEVRKRKLRGAWGTNSTPALQLMECIQTVKAELNVRAADDRTSSDNSFTMLSIGVLLTAVALACLTLELMSRARPA